jgi:hypothetical protein
MILLLARGVIVTYPGFLNNKFSKKTQFLTFAAKSIGPQAQTISFFLPHVPRLFFLLVLVVW